ncbi:MAG: hypothetical protein P4L87_25455 [Formivibrio sp.]|nr:hypothetical protein [Formivibrio sp.]
MTENAKFNYPLAITWCGIIYAALYGVFWYGIGHFYSPENAALSPELLGGYHRMQRTEILVGCTLTCLIAALDIGCVTLLGVKMAKIESPMPIAAIRQIMGGTLMIFLVTLPMIFWAASACRIDSDRHLLHAFDDVAWFLIDLRWPLAMVQMLAAAAVGLSDKSRIPLFPKWTCYLAIEGCAGFALVSFIPFFKTGLLTWHGLLRFWIPFILWFLWLAVFSYYMIRDIHRQLRNLNGGPATPGIAVRLRQIPLEGVPPVR